MLSEAKSAGRIRLQLSDLFWAATCETTLRVLRTVAPHLLEARPTRPDRIPAPIQLSRYAWLCRRNGEQPNAAGCGHSSTPLATVNCADVMQRGPHFGLGKPAIDLWLIHSAETLRHPSPQGGTCVRPTHARLPWALLLNAFSVACRRLGARPRTSELTGPGEDAAERSEPPARTGSG